MSRRLRSAPYHIGLRTVKTGLAVLIALLLDSLRPSAMPIFAAIGAIEVMSRTLSDAKSAAATQLAGTACGAAAGCLLMLLMPHYRYLAIGIGLVLLIPLCQPLRIGFAVPLTCIVFVSVCLNDPSAGSPLSYGVSRFLDTAIGLAVGFAVNAIIKPYNNYPLIQRLFREYLQAYPAALQELLCRGHYPDIQPFGERYRRLLGEVAIFADQPLPSRRRRAHEAAYLRGCCQLAEKMYMSIAALAGMDTLGVPDAAMSARLRAMGVEVADAMPTSGQDEESRVLCYHLKNLLDAHDYLQSLLALPKEP